jgi:hypothetical protein
MFEKANWIVGVPPTPTEPLNLINMIGNGEIQSIVQKDVKGFGRISSYLGNVFSMPMKTLRELHMANDEQNTDFMLEGPEDNQEVITLGKPNSFIGGGGANRYDDVQLYNNGSEVMMFTFDSSTDIKAKLYYSTEPGYDFVNVYVDGVRIHNVSGHSDESNDYNVIDIDLQNIFSLQIQYIKDGSWWAGYDMCYLVVEDAVTKPVTISGIHPDDSDHVVSLDLIAQKKEDGTESIVSSLDMTDSSISTLNITKSVNKMIDYEHDLYFRMKGDWLKPGSEGVAKVNSSVMEHQISFEG